MSYTQSLERKETYPIDAIFTPIRKGLEEFIYHGDTMKLVSQRYMTFLSRGIKCACCGIEGTFFAKERHYLKRKKKNKHGRTIGKDYVIDEKSPFHFNLYGIRDNGKEVLMTKDHIMPKSRGGKNILSNYQTMCTKCNTKKGSDIPVTI